MLRDMIDKTLFAVSSTRRVSTCPGVYLVGGEVGVLRMVATDGHRLAMIERKVSGAKARTFGHPAAEGAGRSTAACLTKPKTTVN
jgi:hypothetical protein